MQLNSQKSIRGAVAAITAGLLGSVGSATAADTSRQEANLLLYSETNRVTALEGVYGISKQLNNGYIVGLRLTYDGLTGATPNGAIPARSAQTFTRPSGRAAFTAPAGQLPLDPSFRDNRIAGDATMSIPVDRFTSFTFGAHLSLEHDYSSIGVNTGLSRDLFNKNTTIGVSGSYSHDVTSAVGGAPTPFSSLKSVTPSNGESEGVPRVHHPGKPKEVLDAVVSLTQILDRRTLFRANYSFDRSSGYQTDPYKVLSLVAADTSAVAGDPVDYIYENRPNLRNKNAVYAEVRRYIGGSTLGLSYRYFWDDWGIKSHTADIVLRLKLWRDKALEPHFRWYHQTGADFFHPFLVQGVAFPTYASADTRLAAFDALTFGLKYLFPIGAGMQFGVGAEYYTQIGDRSPPEAFGSLRGLDLFPQMNALMLRIGFERGL